MGQSRPLFVYFRSFLVTISTQIEKSIDGVFGIQNQGLGMVGTDETTELWRPPPLTLLLPHSKHSDWMLEGRAPVLRDNMLCIVYLPSRLFCSLFVSTDMMR